MPRMRVGLCLVDHSPASASVVCDERRIGHDLYERAGCCLRRMDRRVRGWSECPEHRSYLRRARRLHGKRRASDHQPAPPRAHAGYFVSSSGATTTHFGSPCELISPRSPRRPTPFGRFLFAASLLCRFAALSFVHPPHRPIARTTRLRPPYPQHARENPELKPCVRTAEVYTSYIRRDNTPRRPA